MFCVLTDHFPEISSRLISTWKPQRLPFSKFLGKELFRWVRNTPIEGFSGRLLA